jgi:hypothetical protein
LTHQEVELPKIERQPAPPGYDPELWKNRNRVSVKFHDIEHDALTRYCRDRKCSLNRGVRALCYSNPELQPYFKTQNV